MFIVFTRLPSSINNKLFLNVHATYWKKHSQLLSFIHIFIFIFTYVLVPVLGLFVSVAACVAVEWNSR